MENPEVKPNLQAKDEPECDTTIQTPADMSAFVQNLLGQMQTRFQVMADGIVSKNELGTRIDEMEKSLDALKGDISNGTPVTEEPKPSEC